MQILEKHLNSKVKYSLEVFLAMAFVILISLKSHPFGISLGDNINMMTLSLSVILFFIFIFTWHIITYLGYNISGFDSSYG